MPETPNAEHGRCSAVHPEDEHELCLRSEGHPLPHDSGCVNWPMPDAHEAVVEAMAAALCTDAGNVATSYYRRQARAALAALVRSEAVRAALVAEGMPAVPRDDVWPLVEASPGLTAYYRRRAEAVVDAILAALAPEAT